MSEADPRSPVPREWVGDPAALASLVDRLRGETRVALDTEFHRERSYFPQLALLQVAWPSGIALIDPLATEIRPFAELLADPARLWVLHAAGQDLEVLQRACGTIPARLFDTQVAAGFVGYSTPSLASLVSAELGALVAKADRLTDWLHRPLTASQMAYAASDVAHLLELHDLLVSQLTTRGRLQWALDECEQLRVRPVGPVDPEAAWLRIKDHRSLRGASRGVAQAVAAWRERRAAHLDQPVRHVLADMAVLAIAQRPPTTVDEMRKIRGLDERLTRGTLGTEILSAVQAGRELAAVELRLAESDDLERRLRPAVTLVSAWVSQLARDVEVDTTTLATRSDIVELLRGDPEARLATGWRAEMVGEHIRELVAGRAALAFDGRGALVLEPRTAPPSP